MARAQGARAQMALAFETVYGTPPASGYMLEAEALVYRFGSRGVAMAQTYAQDQSVSDDRRDHYRRVARIAGIAVAQDQQPGGRHALG